MLPASRRQNFCSRKPMACRRGAGSTKAVNFLKLIERKRDGGELSPEAVCELIAEYMAGRIPDYQMAAFLMAVNCRGMSPAETRALTLAMRDSGTVLEFPSDDRPVVDKHSTGGVGDKVSLVLAPLLACLGCRVPMISGRGLGITGGTLDKLESIPGFNTRLSAAQLVDQVQSIGVALGGQTEEIAPADRRLYALRDATGTVPSIPLITASILSKKLAEGLGALVMDVKFGQAAFMPDRKAAQTLAQSITGLAEECGVTCRAVLSDMNTPLGRTAGNWLEVKEAVDCLEGNGPTDLETLTVSLAANLPDMDAGRVLAELASGRPREKFNELLTAQGADETAFVQQLKQETLAPVVREVTAAQSGVIVACDARAIGEAVRDLGGGRQTKEDAIDPSVGIDQLAKPGEERTTGELLARVHAHDEPSAEAAVVRIRESVIIGSEFEDLGEIDSVSVD